DIKDIALHKLENPQKSPEEEEEESRL
ncbi:MAG: hypothetical protein RLZZ148_617, partial [Cyanobacteriota bacterium]